MNKEVQLCKNCDHNFQGYYCPDCGQSASVNRFTMQNLFSGLFISSIDTEKGIVRSIVRLFYKPGAFIREYVHGRRLVLYEPGNLLLITGAVATYLVFNYGMFLGSTSNLPTYLMDVEGYYHFSSQYYTFVNLVGIPIFALFSWLIFKGSKFNYAENLIMNVYVASQQFVLVILLFPMILLFPDHKTDLQILFFITLNAYNIWVLMVFFKTPLISGLIKSGVALVLSNFVAYHFNWLVYLLIPASWVEFFDQLA